MSVTSIELKQLHWELHHEFMLSQASIYQPFFVNLWRVVVNWMEFVDAVNSCQSRAVVIKIGNIFAVGIQMLLQLCTFLFEQLGIPQVEHSFLIFFEEEFEVDWKASVEQIAALWRFAAHCSHLT